MNNDDDQLITDPHINLAPVMVLGILAIIAVSTATVVSITHKHIAAQVSQSAAAGVGANSGYDDRIDHPNKTFKLVIDDNKLKSGPSTITVKQGDSVRVNINAGGSEEVRAELEGYGITTESAPSDDTPGGFSFVADKKGSFKFDALGEANPNGVTPAQRYPIGTIVVQ